MAYSSRVKDIAYRNDPSCWISYSGRPRLWKRFIEARRVAALTCAQRHVDAVDETIRQILAPAPKPEKETAMSRGTDYLENLFRALHSPPGQNVPLNPPSCRDIGRSGLEVQTHKPKPYRSHPIKIAMMLHFATTIGPFKPERQRTSPAYTKFIKQLLNEGLVERPTKRERRDNPGWAYKATNKGRAYVEALKAVQLPELVEVRETWGIPR